MIRLEIYSENSFIKNLLQRKWNFFIYIYNKTVTITKLKED